MLYGNVLMFILLYVVLLVLCILISDFCQLEIKLIYRYKIALEIEV